MKKGSLFRVKHLKFVIVFLMVSACSVGSEYVRPQTTAQQQEAFIHTPEKISAISTSQWWTRLNDPALDQLVAQLLEQNLDLIQAGERVIQAREVLASQRSGFFPSLSAQSDASRRFTSNIQLGDDFQTSRFYVNSYDPTLSTSWEIDLFGRIRRSVESAQSTFQARKSDKDALTQSLISELITRRISIATNQSLLDLAKQNADNRENLYSLVKQRYDLGASGVTLADVYLAEENFLATKSDIHAYERILHEEVYALDMLLGKAPGATDIAEMSFSLLPPPIDVPVCLPADLIDRRPDLRASEFLLIAANADIGVAVADLYPRLTLGGSIGFSGQETRNLFNADQLAGSIIATLSQRIFEGGALRANIRLQESEAREMAAAYAKDVLNALREVETSLKAEQELGRELENMRTSIASLKQAEKISYQRFARGILSLQDFLNMQQRRYNAEQMYLSAQYQKWQTRIALYLALGGDWLGDNKDLRTACDRENEVQNG